LHELALERAQVERDRPPRQRVEVLEWNRARVQRLQRGSVSSVAVRGPE
jgi:hypothetical protein